MLGKADTRFAQAALAKLVGLRLSLAGSPPISEQGRCPCLKTLLLHRFGLVSRMCE